MIGGVGCVFVNRGDVLDRACKNKRLPFVRYSRRVKLFIYKNPCLFSKTPVILLLTIQFCDSVSKQPKIK